MISIWATVLLVASNIAALHVGEDAAPKELRVRQPAVSMYTTTGPAGNIRTVVVSNGVRTTFPLGATNMVSTYTTTGAAKNTLVIVVSGTSRTTIRSGGGAGGGGTKTGSPMSTPGTGMSMTGTGMSMHSTGMSMPGTGMSKPSTKMSMPGTGMSMTGTGMSMTGTGMSMPGTGMSKPPMSTTGPAPAPAETIITTPVDGLTPVTIVVSAGQTETLTPTYKAPTGAGSGYRAIPTAAALIVYILVAAGSLAFGLL